jgi:20S proteasome alpha/beta subunit
MKTLENPRPGAPIRKEPPNRRPEPLNRPIFPFDPKPSYPWNLKAKKNPMTITAGYKVESGILLSADTMYTGGMKLYATKIKTTSLDGGKVAFALAGSEDCSLMLIQACEKALFRSSYNNPSIEQLEEVISSTLGRLFRKHDLQDHDAQFLIAVWTVKDGLRLLSTRKGIVVERDRYYCNGSGEYLANYLIEPAFRVDMSLREVIILATQTLAAVKAHDDGCGGQSELIVLQPDGSLSPVAHEEIITSEKNIAGFETYARRLMFDFANPLLSETEFRKKLDSFADTIALGREGWLEEQDKAAKIRKLLKAVFPGESLDYFTSADPERPKPDPQSQPPSQE